MTTYAAYQESLDSIRATIGAGQYESALTMIAAIPDPDDLYTFVDLTIEKLRCYVMLRNFDLAKIAADEFISVDPERLAYMGSKSKLPPFVDAVLNFIYLFNPSNTLGDPATFPYRKFLSDCGKYDSSLNNSTYQIYLLNWNCENDYLSRTSTGQYFNSLLEALTTEVILSLKDGHKDLLISASNLLQSMATSKDPTTKMAVQTLVDRVAAL